MHRFILLFLILMPIEAFAGEMNILGMWWTESKDSKVEIFDCGDFSPCGKLIWTTDGNPLDLNNPDIEKQKMSLVGRKMMWGYKEKSKKKSWGGGRIYNARNGKTYNSKLTLNEDGSLEVKGCIAFICEGEIWVRIEE